jgi:ProP effector
MTTTKQDIDAALAHLAEAFPQTFVVEKHRPHGPLKVGIAAAIPARCPEINHRVLGVVLSVYTRRVMYLQSVVAGAARVDLDGKAAGGVTAGDAEYAAAKLAGILASRQAKRAAALAISRAAPVSSPTTAPVVSPPLAVPPPAAAPRSAVSTLEKPVLRLPAFRTAAR